MIFMKKSTITAAISGAAAVLVLLAGMSVIGGHSPDSALSGIRNLLSGNTAAAGQESESISRSDFLLNTFVTVTLYDTDDESILDDSLALCKAYEEIFSRTM